MGLPFARLAWNPYSNESITHRRPRLFRHSRRRRGTERMIDLLASALPAGHAITDAELAQAKRPPSWPSSKTKNPAVGLCDLPDRLRLNDLPADAGRFTRSG